MAITESLPQLLADLRAMRDEIRASGSTRGGDPLTNTCNDLALEIMEIGGLNTLIPPQWSGKKPSAETLLAEMARWREANAPREKRTEPAVIRVAVTQPWRF